MFGVVMLEARMKSESEEGSQNDFVREYALGEVDVCLRRASKSHCKGALRVKVRTKRALDGMIGIWDLASC